MLPPPMPQLSTSAADKREHDEFEARDDIRTLGRAEEIRTNKRRMSRAERMAKKDLKSAQRTSRSLTGRR